MEFMEIKSWQIVLLGFFIQVIAAILLSSIGLINDDLFSLIFSTFFISTLFILFLYFDRTRKFAVLFGILLSIFYILSIFIFHGDGFNNFILIGFIFIACIYYLIKSGIYGFYEIESYMVALFGIFVQILIVPEIDVIINGNSTHGFMTMSLIFVYLSFIGFLPILLLYFQRTRKLGAYLSIFVGCLPLLIVLLIFAGAISGSEGSIDNIFTTLRLAIYILFYSIGFILFILAGILYFWRENKINTFGKIS